MARKVFVLALIFVAVVGVAMAAEAPSSSPKSSPKESPAPSSEKSSPKASAPVAEAESPKTSEAPPTLSDSPPAQSPEAEEPVEVVAPASGPTPAADAAASGASSLKISAVVAVAAAGFFAF